MFDPLQSVLTHVAARQAARARRHAARSAPRCCRRCRRVAESGLEGLRADRVVGRVRARRTCRPTSAQRLIDRDATRRRARRPSRSQARRRSACRRRCRARSTAVPERRDREVGRGRPHRRHLARLERDTTAMKLNDEEQAMLAGEARRAWRSIAIEHQIKVGDFFGAADFVPVTQAHIMADTESLGAGRRAWLERWPMQTDGRSARAHPDDHRSARHRLRAAADCSDRRTGCSSSSGARSTRSTRLGVSMTDTCINYQTDPGGDARRARRVRRHRRRHLFELGRRRALELRRRPVGAVGRPHRPHAALRLPPRRAPARDAARSASTGRRAASTTGARSAA